MPVPAMFQGLTREGILHLDPQDCKRIFSIEELETIFKACDAFWHHPGQKNLTAPHVILTSGKHSNIYANCPKVLQRSNLCQIMAQ